MARFGKPPDGARRVANVVRRKSIAGLAASVGPKIGPLCCYLAQTHRMSGGMCGGLRHVHQWVLAKDSKGHAIRCCLVTMYRVES